MKTFKIVINTLIITAMTMMFVALGAMYFGFQAAADSCGDDLVCVITIPFPEAR